MSEALPTKMKRIYKRLMLRELSLVDEPCVPGSDVLVIKAKNPLSPDEPESTDVGNLEGQRSPGGAQALEDDDVVKALEPYRDLVVQLEASQITVPDFMGRAAIVASDLQTQTETGGTPVAKSAAAAALAIVTESTVNLEQLNAAYAALNTQVQAQTAELTVAKARVTELEGLVAVEKARADTAESEVAKARTTTLTPEEQDAEVLKALPEHLRAEVVKSREIAATNAKAAETAAIGTEVAKAKTLGLAEPDAVGAALHTLRTASPEATAVIEKALTAKSAVTKASEAIFKSYGATVESLGDEDPMAQLESKAADIIKARPELSKEAALSAAMEAHPALYEAFITKRRVGAAMAGQ